jgi:hypothetical protein
MHSPFVQQVYYDIAGFLSAPALPFMPVCSRSATVATITANSSPLSLFSYMTENACAEIRAQDALFPFLVSKYEKVERERLWYFDSAKRVFDFFVTHGGEELIIELKHLSPHQSGRHPAPYRFLNLLGPIVAPGGKHIQTVCEDYEKSRPTDVALIQLALYTGIDAWSGGCLQQQVDNYFIQHYVPHALPSSTYKQASEGVLNAWEFRSRYRCPAAPASGRDYREGRACTFTTVNGIDVTGRVNYFMGIAV